MTSDSIELEILLPVFNEASGIKQVVREIYSKISPVASCRFIICEDGSTDNSKEVLNQLEKEFPIRLIVGNERKGYSKAMRDGMQLLKSPFLLCLDSDGQCDPEDFVHFWGLRSDYDVLIGWRKKRADSSWRILFSRFFHIFYQLFFWVPIHDPSCPFVLAKRNVVWKLSREMGEMKQGFWWEFSARVFSAGYKMKEIPVHHRKRISGDTNVYIVNKVVGIFLHHFIALFKIYNQVKNVNKA